MIVTKLFEREARSVLIQQKAISKELFLERSQGVMRRYTV